MAQANAADYAPIQEAIRGAFALLRSTPDQTGIGPGCPDPPHQRQSAKPWDTRANTRSWSAQATTGAASQTLTTPTTSARAGIEQRMADCRQRRRPRPSPGIWRGTRTTAPGHYGWGRAGESRLSRA